MMDRRSGPRHSILVRAQRGRGSQRGIRQCQRERESEREKMRSRETETHENRGLFLQRRSYAVGRRVASRNRVRREGERQRARRSIKWGEKGNQSSATSRTVLSLSTSHISIPSFYLLLSLLHASCIINLAHVCASTLLDTDKVEGLWHPCVWLTA